VSATAPTGTRRRAGASTAVGTATGWYRDAVIYELHVRAFADSNGDGIGDFRGLLGKLDYLQDLGVTAIWLLPFYPSPLRDDGYDTADYRSIHPAYGTLRDFKAFLREAHRRELRVITELVLNHTSDQHPWFQRARRSRPGSRARDFYVWSDTPDRYAEARIIFKDFESSNWTWDPVAGAYYWHRFYSHQPDLNFDNPEVRRALFRVVDHWLEMGVDGLRLDAVPYLFEREGTNCENLPETHAALRELRAHIDARFADRMLLAEANQWPEDSVDYFGDGDECHMAFHFPLMPRMFMAIRQEDRFPVIDILQETPPIPEDCQWAIFLRNHDELTLEMVTDEERDYMYRVYAQDPDARINLGIRHRLAPLLGNDRRLIEMMNGLLFSLPGTPVIYYGDEIGMGDNIYLGDRNGVRTPMQWSSDRNAGFSHANPQRLYLPVVIDPSYHASAVNVESQLGNAGSLLWWMKRLVALRRRHAAFGRGSLEFLYPENRKVLTFLRHHEDEHILVVANLSRFPQYVELDLSAYAGMVPVALLGGAEFPTVGELPYLLTLGPHDFYWFSLERHRPSDFTPSDRPTPALEVRSSWTTLLDEPRIRGRLEAVLPDYVRTRRWFGGKSRRIRAVSVRDVVRVPDPDGDRSRPPLLVAVLEVDYREGDSERYALPVTAMPVPEEEYGWELPPAEIARVRSEEGQLVLYDAFFDPRFGRALLHAVRGRRRLRGDAGALTAYPTPAMRRLAGSAQLEATLLQAEQSNTSVVFEERLLLKWFRRLDDGLNPDLEVGRFLTERAGFEHAPAVAGAIEYRGAGREVATLAIVTEFVPNEGDAWSYTLDVLVRYFEDARARGVEAPAADGSPLALSALEPPEVAAETIGAYLESARMLGRRTAEMHLALARAGANDPAFTPEPVTALYQRSLLQSMRTLTRQVFGLLRRREAHLDGAAAVLPYEGQIVDRFRTITGPKLTDERIRCHGDYHLGQVLWTGRDFSIIDFEGEPARPLSERRIKRSPLRDVAGMLRSFHYAAYTALFAEVGGPERVAEDPVAEGWARFWYRWVAAAFLREYLAATEGAAFLPARPEDLELVLGAFLLEKAVYELQYEADTRPDWLHVPVQGVIDLTEERA
jgi:maltose alpha-D-glucosyltransferase/alpha-amylase